MVVHQRHSRLINDNPTKVHVALPGMIPIESAPFIWLKLNPPVTHRSHTTLHCTTLHTHTLTASVVSICLHYIIYLSTFWVVKPTLHHQNTLSIHFNPPLPALKCPNLFLLSLIMMHSHTCSYPFIHSLPYMLKNVPRYLSSPFS